MTDANPFADILKASSCRACLDTGLKLTRFGEAVRCDYCFTAEERSFSVPAMRLTTALWLQQDQGRRVDGQAFEVARVLTHGHISAPLMIKVLAEHFNLSERKVKDIVRTLRREWLLPIGSLRQPPYGYYWILSPKDFLDWSRAYRSQAIDELATLHRLQRANFPELFGQGSLDFIDVINDDLKEAIK